MNELVLTDTLPAAYIVLMGLGFVAVYRDRPSSAARLHRAAGVVAVVAFLFHLVTEAWWAAGLAALSTAIALGSLRVYRRRPYRLGGNPYSEATVELVTDAIAEATLAPAVRGTRRHARLVLDALCSAGLLLPEGADAGVEYAVRFVSPDGNHVVSADRQQQAHALASSHGRRPGYRADVLLVRSWLVEEIEASYQARARYEQESGGTNPTREDVVYVDEATAVEMARRAEEAQRAGPDDFDELVRTLQGRARGDSDG